MMITRAQISQFKAEINKVQGELKIRLYIYFGIAAVDDAIELNAVDKLMDYKAFADNYFHIPVPSFRCWYLRIKNNEQ